MPPMLLEARHLRLGSRSQRASAVPAAAADEETRASHRRPACRRDSTGRSTSTRPWGTFGFANSLYTNPKPDQPSGDLSDNWIEGSIKPALSAYIHD